MKAIKRRHRLRRVLWLFVAGSVIGLVALEPVADDRSTTARAETETDVMAVDADPATPAADAGRTVAASASLEIDVVIASAPQPYRGYGATLEYDPSVLGFEGLVHLQSDRFGGLCSNSAMAEAANQVAFGCGGAADQTFAGPVARITFRCIAEGTSLLHLIPPSGVVNKTTMLGPGGAVIPTSLTDAQITCGEGSGPVPTPPPGATPAPVSPGPTPTGPLATPTPLPPGMEAVPLVAGCNPVTSTYPDGTPIQTVANAVGPAGNLVSLWEFEVGTWRAYSPQYPQASDLTEADLLDVVFACVGGPGALARPVV